ncbi:MAG: indolepyruvate ferredoxin oxidoreductase family protein [Gammaproteobacteria bacterium]|nr:indolepyruvate ferredoxin oxidoreductase family protein [Gammaproteobacteria bacterium]
MLDDYQLVDRYRRTSGRVFLTGTQALVRLPMLQRQLDRRNKLNTAGFISGYRGSPLGGYDQALWAAREFLDAHQIEFMPAVNEELAATAIMGTQQVEGDPDSVVDGVFSIWYGKGPGVDRAGDAMKHGNAYGSSPHGGVLVIAGDDHGCVSSSMSHQSDVAFMAWFMPTLNPASVQEYIEFGLFGFALSRFAGVWVGFKAISETVESAVSVTLDELPEFRIPMDFSVPEAGLHYRWPDFPGPQVEARLVEKLDAVRSFARLNRIDRRIYDVPGARLGIITTGKGHFDLMEALALLGVDEQRARTLGIDIYKIGMVWPLETAGARAFLRGKKEVLVIEEKRGIIESELKESLYDFPGDKPYRMVGKYDESGNPLVPWTGELSPALLAPIVAARITQEFPDVHFTAELDRLAAGAVDTTAVDQIQRQPYFCSGCPHNRSTKVPRGSKALAGIGCHFMATWMNRETESLIQMGGEGVNWVGKSRFTGNKHIFQNLGEGTYFHSGSMAIRQALAAGTNITYKILFNDAVAMTGGQPVDGSLTVPDIAFQVRAEGVARIAVVSDDPDKYQPQDFPGATSFHGREDLDAVQRELRDIPGVTVLIYDQACATELRRRRKRGEVADLKKRIFINQAVCEGCGDCSAQSNCLSIFPVYTELGRKRKIDQSSCNKDFSCIDGFCPSFVTVEGAELRRREGSPIDDFSMRLENIGEPTFDPVGRSYDLLIAGIGGTGVTTVGALVTMAAHLEGKGASVLDFTGFAQKGGSVLSYVRLSETPKSLNQVRIDQGMADALIACDVVVATDVRALQVLRRGHTRVIANRTEIPTGDMVQDRDADIALEKRIERLEQSVGEGRVTSLSANELVEFFMGHSIYANVLILGFAWQQGLIPLTLAALSRAIELNGVSVAENKRAFALGRLAAADSLPVYEQAEPRTGTLEETIAYRVAHLTDYQNAEYAESYRGVVERVRAAEAVLDRGTKFTEAVARNLCKLMAYKDEYEVARLFTDGRFARALEDTFEPGFRLTFHMAPPLISRAKDADGRPRKTRLGGWMMPLMKLLAKARIVRGRWWDPLGHTAERRAERALVREYLQMLDGLLSRLDAKNHSIAVQLASLPDRIRGYGPVKQQAIEETGRERERLLTTLRMA